MAATAQNHMEPLRSEGKKDEDFEEEREYGASAISVVFSPFF